MPCGALCPTRARTKALHIWVVWRVSAIVATRRSAGIRVSRSACRPIERLIWPPAPCGRPVPWWGTRATYQRRWTPLGPRFGGAHDRCMPIQAALAPRTRTLHLYFAHASRAFRPLVRTLAKPTEAIHRAHTLISNHHQQVREPRRGQVSGRALQCVRRAIGTCHSADAVTAMCAYLLRKCCAMAP